MRRLFFRVYFAVLGAVLVGMVASQLIVGVGYDLDMLDENSAYIELVHPRIAAELVGAPREQWPAILAWWEEVSEYTIAVYAADDEFWSNHEQLVPPFGGQLVIEVYSDARTDYVWAAYPILGTDQIVYYELADSSSFQYLIVEWFDYVLIFSVVAAAVYFLLLPIMRSAQDLTSTAQSYSEGRLDARVAVAGTGLLAQLSLQFNRMAEEIQHRIHEQEVMTTAISHELKTPLTRLRLALDMALASHDETTLREMLVEMNHDVDDLDDLTAELLTLAKLTYTGRELKLQRVPIAAIFDRLIPKLTGLEPPVRFSVEGAKGVESLGNEEHLTRAFSNLLINGQRYARSEVKVKVAVEREEVVVSVEDDGTGIPADRREEIFMPFARLDLSRNRDTGGFGLGLAIVKQSLEVQGGQIHVSESEMGGARFVVRLQKA